MTAAGTDFMQNKYRICNSSVIKGLHLQARRCDTALLALIDADKLKRVENASGAFSALAGAVGI